MVSQTSKKAFWMPEKGVRGDLWGADSTRLQKLRQHLKLPTYCSKKQCSSKENQWWRQCEAIGSGSPSVPVLLATHSLASWFVSKASDEIEFHGSTASSNNSPSVTSWGWRCRATFPFILVYSPCPCVLLICPGWARKKFEHVGNRDCWGVFTVQAHRREILIDAPSCWSNGFPLLL